MTICTLHRVDFGLECKRVERTICTSVGPSGSRAYDTGQDAIPM